MVHSEEKYGRDSLVVPVDFSDGLEIYDAISEKLKDLSIGVLGKYEYYQLLQRTIQVF